MCSDFERQEEKLSYFFLTQYSLSEQVEDMFLHQFFMQNPNLISDFTQTLSSWTHFFPHGSIRRPPILKTSMTNIGGPLSRLS